MFLKYEIQEMIKRFIINSNKNIQKASMYT